MVHIETNIRNTRVDRLFAQLLTIQEASPPLPAHHLLARNDAPKTGSISLHLVSLGLVLAVSIPLGVMTAYFPISVVAALSLVIGWTILTRLPSLALAILMVGFFVYPVTVNAIGFGTSSTLTALYYVAISTAALTGAYHVRSQPIGRIFHRFEMLIMLAFGVWMIANWLVFSLSNDLALKKISSAPWLMVIPFLVPQFMDRESLERFLMACIAIGAFGTLLTVLHVVRGTHIDMLRLSVSDSVSALGFAYSIGIGALLAINHSLSSTRSRERFLSIVLMLGVIAVIIGSGSRGPLLALAIGLLVVGASANRANRVYLLLVVGISALVGIAVLPYASSVAQSRMGTFSSSSDFSVIERFVESRGYLWRYSLDAWLSNPLFGIGLGNYVEFSRNASLWVASGFAHNFLLEVLSELGLIGIVLFGCFLAVIVRNAVYLAQKHRTDVVAVSAVALFVFSLVKMSFSGQLQYSVEFWASCGVIASLSAKYLLVAPKQEQDFAGRLTLQDVGEKK